MTDFTTIISKPAPHEVFAPMLDAIRARYEAGSRGELLILLRARRSEMRTELDRARAGYRGAEAGLVKAGITHFDADRMVARLGDLIGALESEREVA